MQDVQSQDWDDDDDFTVVQEGRDLSYLHCPFLDPANYLQARNWLFERPTPAIGRAISPRRRGTLTSPQDEAALAEWDQRGFTSTERDVWMAAGLGRYDSHLAEYCCSYDIAPATLQSVVDGRRIAERLRSGESVASVVARLQNASA